MERYLPKLSDAALRWVRFAGLVVALGLLCWLAYGLRTVSTPLLVALALAYVLNPVVTWFEETRGVRRLTTVIVTFALVGALVLGGGLYLGSKTVAQVRQFQDNLPRYIESVGQWIGDYRSPAPKADPPTTTLSVAAGNGSAPTTEPAAAAQDEWWGAVAPLLEKHGVAAARTTANYLVGFVSSVASLVTLLVLIPVFTFYFLWRFNDIVRTLHDHLPAAYRDGAVHVVKTIDGAVANFFRGRLIVCLLVGGLSGIGWSLVGVPYSLPLGVLAGTLNLVPFMSLLALPPALLFAYLGAAEANAPWVWPVILAMGVYMVVQALESFLFSPYVEGRSSGLHPLAIVVALLIGAQLAGLLGMLLAIPVASTLKTFAAELLLPEIRRLAAPPAGQPAGEADAGGQPVAHAVDESAPEPETPRSDL